MRARHRHFNPRDAGANLIYDSRRLHGLSDNDPVDTWLDISRNGYDCSSTGTARPLYKVGNQGGNPTVRFDGVDDLMEIPSGPSLNTGAGHELQVVIKQISITGGGFPLLTDLKTNNADNWVFILSSNASYKWPSFGCATGWSNLRWDTASNTNSNIFNVGYNGSGATTGSNFKLFYNGINQTLTNANGYSSATGPAFIGGRVGTGIYNNSDYYQFTLINDSTSDSLRKKLNHAAAFSFKIPCS